MASKSDVAKAKFKQDFKSGKMKVNAGEIISPGKIVAKLATKVAAKVAVKTAANAKTVATSSRNTKKVAESAIGRARSNSAAAAKAVAPKNLPITASRIKMAKTANARKKFDAANQKRILDNQVKKSVEVLPRKTAPKTDLSNRGAKLTKAERAERAQDYQFDKSLGKHFSSIDRIAGTHPSELKHGSRLEGKRLARKTAAIKKEGKPIVKVNSNPRKSK